MSKEKDKPKLLLEEDRLAQATVMMAKRLFEHKTVQAIADEFGLERTTVSRRLALARKHGVPEEARSIFIRDFLPSAMAVVHEALKSRDEKIRLQTARMIIEGLDAMKPPETVLEAKRGGSKGDDDSYEVWRERIRITRKAVDAAQREIGGSSREAGDIIDASAIPPAERSLPPGDSPEDAPAD